MPHNLKSFLAPSATLRLLALHVGNLRILELPQGVALAPIPRDLWPLGDDEPAGPDGFIDLPGSLADTAVLVSRAAPIGWIETEWFGGVGESRAALWRGGVMQCMDSVNALLREFGVRPENGQDEWDSVGLGEWRSTGNAYRQARQADG